MKARAVFAVEEREFSLPLEYLLVATSCLRVFTIAKTRGDKHPHGDSKKIQIVLKSFFEITAHCLVK